MLRVLLVFADIVDALMGRRALMRAGVAVVVVPRGADALAWIAAEPVDLVVVEPQLLDMTGLRLLTVVRDRYPLLPVVLVTNSAEAEAGLEALKAGAADHFVSNTPAGLAAALMHGLRDVHWRYWMAARAREARTRIFAYTMADSWFCTDAAGTVRACDGLRPEAVAREPARLIGRRVDRLFAPPVAEPWLQTLGAVLTDGAPREFEFPSAAAGGTRTCEGRVRARGRDELYTFVRRAVDREWVEAQRRRRLQEVQRAVRPLQAANGPGPGPRLAPDRYTSCS